MLTRHSDDEWRRLIDGLHVQAHVIGALLMRELHTRYGRDNIGYAWLLIEPMTLALAVSALHFGQGAHGASNILPVPFTIGGYCMFMIFRGVIGKAESTIDPNKPLLYHRMVTLFDMMVARALLEAVSALVAMVVLLAGAYSIGLANEPYQPMMMLAAWLYMVWFSFALGMSICAACYMSKAASKFVHPVVYLLMPISGTFFILGWIPEPYRTWLTWLPLNQIFEMFHSAHFASVDSPYVDLIYLTGWCLVLTLVGLVSLRIVRTHIHLS